MCRQAMHEQEVGLGVLDKLFIDLIWRRLLLTLLLFSLKAHAGPYVRVDDVRLFNRFARIAERFDTGAALGLPLPGKA